jgi:hypothetical protein
MSLSSEPASESHPLTIENMIAGISSAAFASCFSDAVLILLTASSVEAFQMRKSRFLDTRLQRQLAVRCGSRSQACHTSADNGDIARRHGALLHIGIQLGKRHCRSWRHSQSLLESDGFQCAFCTPGQICSSVAMLEACPQGQPCDPSRTFGLTLSTTRCPSHGLDCGKRQAIGEIGITGFAAVANAF